MKCECDHLVQVSQDFLQWITAGRDRYATYYAEKNLAFQNAQHAYQQKKLMHEKEVVDARARYARVNVLYVLCVGGGGGQMDGVMHLLW